jgi:hypothetical protein
MRILYSTSLLVESDFLEVYEYLMYCLIVLQFFLQYLMSAENVISS